MAVSPGLISQAAESPGLGAEFAQRGLTRQKTAATAERQRVSDRMNTITKLLGTDLLGPDDEESLVNEMNSLIPSIPGSPQFSSGRITSDKKGFLKGIKELEKLKSQGASGEILFEGYSALKRRFGDRPGFEGIAGDLGTEIGAQRTAETTRAVSTGIPEITSASQASRIAGSLQAGGQEQLATGVLTQGKAFEDVKATGVREVAEAEATEAGRATAIRRGIPSKIESAEQAEAVFNQLDQEGALPVPDAGERTSLRKEIDGKKITKDQVLIQGQADRIGAALHEADTSKSLLAVDQALITILNKMLDPTSVVRESEYARTPGDQGLLSRLRGKAEKQFKGGAGLTDVERQAVARLSIEFARLHNDRFQRTASQFRRLAIQGGINPIDVIPTETEPTGVQAVTPGGAEGAPEGDATRLEAIRKRKAELIEKRGR